MTDNTMTEQSVLGAILIEAARVMPLAAEQLRAEDFLNAGCRSVYAACLRRFEQQRPIDPIALIAELGDEYREYVIGLIETCPSVSASIKHIPLVAQASCRKRAIDAAMDLQVALDGGEPLEDCQTKAAQLAQSMTAQRSRCVGAAEGFQMVREAVSTPRTYIETGFRTMESNRLLSGNGYALIIRSRLSARPVELLPLSPSLVQIWLDDAGRIWYLCTNPRTGERRKVIGWDMLHYKAYSCDGISGISVISRAAEVIQAGRAQQQYEGRFYGKNAQPSGVLTVDAQLEKTSKDKIREEWDRLYSGVDNSFRIAVLDLGMKYAPVSVTQKEAQFIESKAVTVEDIARFFGVSLHKLMAGKQAYNSNEQNSIEYVTGTLAPTVTQCDQEDTYKLLFDSEITRGMRIKRNMLAELKGDTRTRAEWYRTMREVGVFSANDIRALEDLPGVPGGETRYASLNYVPLDQFSALSAARNQNKGGDKTD